MSLQIPSFEQNDDHPLLILLINFDKAADQTLLIIFRVPRYCCHQLTPCHHCLQSSEKYKHNMFLFYQRTSDPADIVCRITRLASSVIHTLFSCPSWADFCSECYIFLFLVPLSCFSVTAILVLHDAVFDINLRSCAVTWDG